MDNFDIMTILTACQLDQLEKRPQLQ